MISAFGNASSQAAVLLDNYVYEAVRHFLKRRRKMRTRATRSFPAEVLVFVEYSI